MSPNPVSDRADRLAQAIAERVVNHVLEAVDVERLLERVDVNALLDRVDVNALVQRVDINALVDHIDVDAIVDKLDIDALVSHTELGSIIAKSTTTVMTEVLDLIRAQGVGLDDFLSRWTNRLLHRPSDSLPVGPPLLIAAGNSSNSATLPAATSTARPPSQR